MLVQSSRLLVSALRLLPLRHRRAFWTLEPNGTKKCDEICEAILQAQKEHGVSIAPQPRRNYSIKSPDVFLPAIPATTCKEVLERLKQSKELAELTRFRLDENPKFHNI